MKFENRCVIPVARARLWDYMTVVPQVALCLPGVVEVNALEDGNFDGILAFKVGVVKLRLSGKISIELMDHHSRRAMMTLQAADQRISGMIRGKLTMNLQELAAEETELIVETELNLFGKIGEFGQPIIKKKADQMMTEFASNVAHGVAETPKSGGDAA